MRIFPTKTHALLDYLVGVLLFISPWVFGFETGGAKMAIPLILGTLLPIGSLFTKYEGGLIRVIPMPVHLVIDVLAGAFLAASPWLFGFSETVRFPHLVFGCCILLITCLTDPRPYTGNQPDPDRAIP